MSWSSLAVIVVTFSILQSTSNLREAFRLPVPPAVVCLLAAAAAAFVVHRCRDRPGRRFPRYWSLGLLVAALLAPALRWLDPLSGGSPWRHAAGLALLAGSLSLAPRLLTVRPDSRRLELVAPLAVIAALAVLLPMLLAGRWAFARQIDAVGEAIAALRSATATVNGVAETDWSRLGTDPSSAEAALAPLAALDPQGLRLEPDLWRTATVTGQDRELAAAASGLATAAVAALGPSRVPRVSVLGEPAVRWDQNRETWIPDDGFRRGSEIVGGYHRRLGELFAAVDPEAVEAPGIDPEAPELKEYRAAYDDSRSALRRQVEAAARSWPDRWAVARIPEAARVPGALDPRLEVLLRSPLTRAGAEELAPADLWRLMEIRLSRARELASETPGCFYRSYGENEHDFARLDCYTYRPRTGEGLDGAELSIELRLVYMAAAGRLEARRLQSPEEVYFLFPVPEAATPEKHLQAVAEAVARTVADRWTGDFRFLDRSGSALHGFVLERDGRSLIVYRPRIESFVGDTKVVAVRGEWRRR